MGKTLYDKIWDAHVVANEPNGETILYIDLHLIHEVTSPQAFAGLRANHRPVRRPDLTLAVADHNIPTEGQGLGVDAVADLLVRVGHEMLEQPQLSLSMIQANNLAQKVPGSGEESVDAAFEQIVMRTAGYDADPSPDHDRRARLVIQCWFGVLMAVLNGRYTSDDADADVRRACELLLA